MESTTPTFSIVIPTYRRSERLHTALESLAQLDYPHSSFEVLIIDDGSEFSPKQIIEVYKKKIDIQLLVQKHAGPATARNLGAAIAKYTFLAFTDDDCSPAPDWLQKLAARFNVNPKCGIGGRVVNALLENSYSAASQLLIDYLYGYFNADYEKCRLFTANNLAFPKDEFLSAGGYETSFKIAGGEDRELCDRWIQKGVPLIYAPEVLVYHRHVLSARGFLRQHFNYGRGSFHYRKMSAVKNHSDVPLEPLSFYWNLVRYPLLNSHAKNSWRMAALMGISQAATVTGYLREKFLGKQESQRELGR